ncbi:hypothetical protein GTY67_10430 [Streptomyces sp. SID8374]|uniref:hypothetical protein n=1 Tax=Streptomyces sp. SID8374 TaxID=2690354 RepID=UPI00136F4229|nr:hypothetical protein [Streptomyces sp. SID8374]MYX13831.1 hypothetical protein [Streptomyces sp. SID8374]
MTRLEPARFDQFWRTEDGRLVIVEAKGPKSDMDSRALFSPLGAKGAQQIRTAMDSRELQYILVHASENQGTWAGARMKDFKIFRGEAR